MNVWTGLTNAFASRISPRDNYTFQDDLKVEIPIVTGSVFSVRGVPGIPIDGPRWNKYEWKSHYNRKSLYTFSLNSWHENCGFGVLYSLLFIDESCFDFSYTRSLGFKRHFRAFQLDMLSDSEGERMKLISLRERALQRWVTWRRSGTQHRGFSALIKENHCYIMLL